jgi:hypothetical protein
MQNNSIDQARAFSLSRRQFLRADTGAELGFGLGVSSLLSLPGCATRLSSGTAPWSELASRLQGALLRPCSPEFAARARPWALQYASELPQSTKSSHASHFFFGAGRT